MDEEADPVGPKLGSITLTTAEAGPPRMEFHLESECWSRWLTTMVYMIHTKCTAHQATYATLDHRAATGGLTRAAVEEMKHLPPTYNMKSSSDRMVSMLAFSDSSGRLGELADSTPPTTLPYTFRMHPLHETANPFDAAAHGSST